MKEIRVVINWVLLLIVLCISAVHLHARGQFAADTALSGAQKSLIAISAVTAKGDLTRLRACIHTGLDAGLTVNEIKEAMVHLYAYCGFPRSIRGLQTFMSVLDERKGRGITDVAGREASPVKDSRPKYERGREVLARLSKTPQSGTLSGYNAFAPQIDVFLKEHLFADIFERDALSYSQRELVTVAVLAGLGGVEPMLRSHLGLCLNVGITPDQLHAFVKVIKVAAGRKRAKDARKIVGLVLNSDKK